MIQVLVMYALFGSIFTVGKIAVTAAAPFFLTSIRMFLAGGALLSYLYFTDKQKLRVSRQSWGLLMGVAFFNVFITNAFEFWGLQYMDAGKTSLIYNLAPFIAALIAYFLGTEVMTPSKWLGLAIGTCALAPMMLEPWVEEGSSNLNALELLAEGALLISAFTCAIGWNFVKKLTVGHQLSGVVINGYSFLLAGGMSLLPSILFEEWHPIPVSYGSTFLWTLLYIVIIHNLICYSIFAKSLRRFSVTFMTFVGLTNSLFAALFGLLFLGEEITLSFIIAFVGVSVGLTIFYLEERSPVSSSD